MILLFLLFINFYVALSNVVHLYLFVCTPYIVFGHSMHPMRSDMFIIIDHRNVNKRTNKRTSVLAGTRWVTALILAIAIWEHKDTLDKSTTTNTEKRRFKMKINKATQKPRKDRNGDETRDCMSLRKNDSVDSLMYNSPGMNESIKQG